MGMNQDEIIKMIQAKTGVAESEIFKTLEAFSQIIGQELASGRAVEIPEFGKYTLVGRAGIDEENSALAEDQDLPVENVRNYFIDGIIPKKVMNLIPKHIVRHFQVIPIEEKEDRLVVAMVEPDDLEARLFLKRKIGRKLEIKPCSMAELNYFLSQYV
jgi:nucleoid DNA-binding protein